MGAIRDEDRPRGFNPELDRLPEEKPASERMGMHKPFHPRVKGRIGIENPRGFDPEVDVAG
jgi:hypothetical protein